MDVNANDRQAAQEFQEEEVPLPVQDIHVPDTVERNAIHRAISQTFQNIAHLANLLPTGTVLAFQLLAPIFTNVGECDHVNKVMTSVLIASCGMSSFLLSFSDSVKDKDSNVCYGFATFHGLWLIDCIATIPPQVAVKYRLRVMDFVHAFMSVLVFAAIALFDKNTVQCFYPMPCRAIQEVLTALPVGIGVTCSMLFVAFPTQRHGIGFPLTSN